MKNKIEQFASMERDFPGLLLQAQQYLLFRVDMSDLTSEALTKGQPALPPGSRLSFQRLLHFPNAAPSLPGLWKHLKIGVFLQGGGEPRLVFSGLKKGPPCLAEPVSPAASCRLYKYQGQHRFASGAEVLTGAVEGFAVPPAVCFQCAHTGLWASSV